jgi:uncharacterized surface protein with fasciclin (FAS1) repeats
MRKLMAVFALLTLTVILAVPAFAQDRPDIPTYLAEDPDGRFTTLVAAVEAAGLGDTLSGEGPFTVFAPTNDAIASSLESLGLSAADLLGNSELLTQILQYHVVPGRYFFRNLSGGATLDTALEGATLSTTQSAGIFSVNDVTISDVDGLASNGVVFAIDSVLLPPGVTAAAPAAEAAAEPAAEPVVAAQERPDIPTYLAEDPDGRFTTLLAAVEAAGLGETLSGEGPFTVFAPTNDAIASTLEFLGLSPADLLGNSDLLTQILQYHVVPGRYFFRNLSGGATLDTVQGSPLSTVQFAGTFSVNNATISDVDGTASNGVVFAIDSVLLPPGLLPAANIRVAHFSPDAPAVDVYVSNSLSGVQGLEFANVTDWIALPPGNYSIAVTPAGESLRAAVIGPADFTLLGDTWTTIAAVGSAEAGTLAPALIAEDNSELDAETARVTVFHAIEGAPAVDVRADGSVVISALAYPGTVGDNDGAFTIEVPAGTYDIQVTPNGASTPVLLDLAGTELSGGTHYFVAAVGTADSPSVAVKAVELP